MTIHMINAFITIILFISIQYFFGDLWPKRIPYIHKIKEIKKTKIEIYETELYYKLRPFNSYDEKYWFVRNEYNKMNCYDLLWSDRTCDTLWYDFTFNPLSKINECINHDYVDVLKFNILCQNYQENKNNILRKCEILHREELSLELMRTLQRKKL